MRGPSGNFASLNHLAAMHHTATPEDYNLNGLTFDHLTTAGPDNGQLAEFLAHYIAAGLQLADEELQDATREDIAPADVEYMQADCAKFLTAAFSAGHLTTDSDFAQAGTDFWLTRNGHGAGFWDRPEQYGELAAEALSEQARQAGPADFELGDDGHVYHYPPVSYLTK